MALRTPSAFLGLDITPTAIKLVELINRGRRAELSTYAIAPRPPRLGLPALTPFMRRLFEQAQVSSDVAVFSLPARDVFGARFTLPRLPAEELSRIIRFKAGEMVPAALTDVHLAWRVNQQPAAVDVYLTAVSKRLALEYQQLARGLELDIAALEPEGLALARAPDVSPRERTLVINFERELASCHVLQDGLPQASFLIEWEAAPAADPAPFIASLARRLPAPPPSQTLLAGSSTPAPGLVAALRRVLPREPQTAYPWTGLAYPQELESLLVDLGPSLAVAAGLARRQLAPSV